MSLKFPILLTGKRAASLPNIAGLQLWLDADDDSTIFNDDTAGSLPANGEDVQRWEDKSTNANHFKQATASRCPHYTASVAQANGRAGIRFTGTKLSSSTHLLTDNDFVLDQTSRKTIFTVCRPTLSTDITYGSPWSLYTEGGIGSAGHVTTEPAYRCNSVTWIGDDPAELTTNASVITIDQDLTPSPTQLHDVITLWRNGNLVTRQTGVNGTIVNQGSRVIVGQLLMPPDLNFPFNGDIYEILVYDTQLSASDRAAVEAYLTAKWGIPVTTPPSKTFGHASRLFDGIDDDVTVTDNSGDLKFTNFGTSNTDKPFTISAWVNMNTTSTFRIFIKDRDSGATQSDYFLSTSAEDNFIILLHDSTDGGEIRIDTTATMSQYQNTWTHMAVTYDGSSTAAGLKLYINGNLQGVTDESFGTYTCMRALTNDVYIGADDLPGTRYWTDGKIADLRAYSAELSSTDIADLENGVDVTTNLVGQWLGNSDSLDDYVAGSTNDGVNNGSAWTPDGPFDP